MSKQISTREQINELFDQIDDRIDEIESDAAAKIKNEGDDGFGVGFFAGLVTATIVGLFLLFIAHLH